MQVGEGEGWRLAFNPLKSPFPLLVGGRQWAAELTLVEAQALQRAVAKLVQQHAGLVDQLLAEEALSLEFETRLAGEGQLWLSLEGHWEAGATAAFVAALGALRLAPVEPSE